jgi:predicted aspartyl protease
MAINAGQAHGIEVPPGLEKTVLGYGAQGVIHGYRGTVRALEIGGFRFDNVATTYSTVEEGGSKVDEVMVGMGILSRFNVIFDYPGRRLLVTPNRRFGDAFAAPPADGARPAGS